MRPHGDFSRPAGIYQAVHPLRWAHYNRTVQKNRPRANNKNKNTEWEARLPWNSHTHACYFRFSLEVCLLLSLRFILRGETTGKKSCMWELPRESCDPKLFASGAGQIGHLLRTQPVGERQTLGVGLVSHEIFKNRLHSACGEQYFFRRKILWENLVGDY